MKNFSVGTVRNMHTSCKYSYMVTKYFIWNFVFWIFTKIMMKSVVFSCCVWMLFWKANIYQKYALFKVDMNIYN